MCYRVFFIITDCCVTCSWLLNTASVLSKISHSWTGWKLMPESSWHSVWVTWLQLERKLSECCQLLEYLAFSRKKNPNKKTLLFEHWDYLKDLLSFKMKKKKKRQAVTYTEKNVTISKALSSPKCFLFRIIMVYSLCLTICEQLS